MSRVRHAKKIKTLLAMLSVLSGCAKGGHSFSLLGDSSTFTQSTAYTARKIDILWVIDNSGSMETSQSNLAANFSRFIQKMQTLQFDFRMAVTTTDAYKGKFQNNDSLRRIKDGTSLHHSGIFVISNTTPDLQNVFVVNATQGITGSGDERAFASIEDVLSYNGNSDFRRSDAYLAIIILSDEDDFSAKTATYINDNYSNPNIISVDHYKQFLDGYAGVNNYSVNAISILDEQCKTLLNSSWQGRKIGNRYKELVTLSGGAAVSLCEDFGSNLQLISDKILELNSSFQISREPIIATIKIVVDGKEVPQDSVNGWTYDSTTKIITFHGSSIPASGANINISFEPVSAKN